MAIETTSIAARERFKALMDKVVEDREVVLVRRRQGGDVALVGAELEALLETAQLLRSPRNAARPLTGLERARSGTLPLVQQRRSEPAVPTAVRLQGRAGNRLAGIRAFSGAVLL